MRPASAAEVAAATPVDTQPFRTSWTEADPESYARTKVAIAQTAADFGVSANSEIGPAVLETLPPQGYVTGTLTGPRGAVEAAAKAIEELELGY